MRTGPVRVARLSTAAQAAFTHVGARDRERARVVVVPLLTPGVAAMTLGRWVLVRRGREADVALLAHELVHVEQWRRLGGVRFLARYVGEHLRLRVAGRPHWAAYAAISLEVEARARAGA
jgi:hypothetical protein